MPTYSCNRGETPLVFKRGVLEEEAASRVGQDRGPNVAHPPQSELAADNHVGHRERLRQRFLRAPSALADYEILEMLLFAARTRGDTKPLAKALLAEFGSLGGVLGAEPSRLRATKGADSDAVIAALKLVQEAAVRLARAEVMQRPIIASWQALIDYCQIALSQNVNEQFRVLFLDRRNTLIADELQQEGTVDHTPVYPREVLKRALELSASAIIMVHNHPSGDPTPSKADIEMTRQVRDAAKAVGISLHDHLVVGRGRHASFKSLGLL
ncbi:MAG TPA: DNA repair protein RadC [Candidatus Cybelea sp.]|nr:DNA repair protein RadC [Candidatus Cybelea sp.]